jgi:hypothetical protein
MIIRSAGSFFLVYAPTQLVAPRAVRMADAMDAISWEMPGDSPLASFGDSPLASFRYYTIRLKNVKFVLFWELIPDFGNFFVSLSPKKSSHYGNKK